MSLNLTASNLEVLRLLPFVGIYFPLRKSQVCDRGRGLIIWGCLSEASSPNLPRTTEQTVKRVSRGDLLSVTFLGQQER